MSECRATPEQSSQCLRSLCTKLVGAQVPLRQRRCTPPALRKAVWSLAFSTSTSPRDTRKRLKSFER
eukprot:963365-Rhodomonas_salina.2